MSSWLIQVIGWLTIAAFFAYYFRVVCKAQARDPRTRGDFQNPGNDVG
jgi:hypothetical protein